MSDLRITLVQSALHWEDVNTNLAMFAEKISSLKEETDIIILPEMFTTGFSMNAPDIAEPMNGKAVQWMKETAKQKSCVVTGSIAVSENGKFYNRLVWMQPDGAYHIYDKRHLFRLAGEEKTYAPGQQKLIAEWKGWRICPLICYDLRFPVWSRRTRQEDYDLLIYVANWPVARVFAWKHLLIARAIENQCYLAGVNRTGKDGLEFEHTGESAALNFKGETLSHFQTGIEAMETIVLNKEALTEFRNRLPFIEDADAFNISGKQ